jgi:hypothetical protein
MNTTDQLSEKQAKQFIADLQTGALGTSEVSVERYKWLYARTIQMIKDDNA